MGKKKKKDKIKKVKDKSKVEERLKSIANIQAPEKVEFKLENEERIDKYMRFSRAPKPKLAKKVENRMRTKNR